MHMRMNAARAWTLTHTHIYTHTQIHTHTHTHTHTHSTMPPHDFAGERTSCGLASGERGLCAEVEVRCSDAWGGCTVACAYATGCKGAGPRA